MAKVGRVTTPDKGEGTSEVVGPVKGVTAEPPAPVADEPLAKPTAEKHGPASSSLPPAAASLALPNFSVNPYDREAVAPQPSSHAQGSRVSPRAREGAVTSLHVGRSPLASDATCRTSRGGDR